jgi:hypothetical protein
MVAATGLEISQSSCPQANRLEKPWIEHERLKRPDRDFGCGGMIVVDHQIDIRRSPVISMSLRRIDLPEGRFAGRILRIVTGQKNCKQS